LTIFPSSTISDLSERIYRNFTFLIWLFARSHVLRDCQSVHPLAAYISGLSHSITAADIVRERNVSR